MEEENSKSESYEVGSNESYPQENQNTEEDNKKEESQDEIDSLDEEESDEFDDGSEAQEEEEDKQIKELNQKINNLSETVNNQKFARVETKPEFASEVINMPNNQKIANLMKDRFQNFWKKGDS